MLVFASGKIKRDFLLDLERHPSALMHTGWGNLVDIKMAPVAPELVQQGVGENVKRSIAMARIALSEIEKAEIAAKCGAADALFELGLAYSTGSQVDQDLVTAHKWFNLAALKGNSAAREYRSEIAHELSCGEVAEAQRKAREWLQTH